MVEPGRERVLKTVWPWQNADIGEAVKAERSRKIRAVTQALAMILCSFLLWLVFNKAILAAVVLFLASVILLTGLWIPAAFAAIDQWGKKFAALIAVALTWMLLTPCFYLIFVPARLFRAFSGADPLGLTFPTKEATYWKPHATARSLEQFRRQS